MADNRVRDQIIESVDIVDYISGYVELKKSGRDYLGLCPFHSEKTPSFTVSQNKKLYYCFGCSASGNLITFTMRFHNLGYLDSLKFLCEKYGIQFQDDGSNEYYRIITSLNEEYSHLAVNNLFSKDNNEKLTYLKNRGFTEDLINEFDIGYVDAGLDISTLIKKYGKKHLIQSGNFFDNMSHRFKDRILIPIKNVIGKVVGFSGRKIDSSLPKYLNSPENDIFKKREILYNIDKAKDYIKSSGYSIVTEGYFDVIRLHEKKFLNSVCSMGTAFSREQAAILKRYSDESIIIFDGDSAGIKAAYKALDTFIDINFFPSVVFLPEGDDPDSFLKKNNIDEFNTLIDKKYDLLLYLSSMLKEKSYSVNEKINNMKKIRDKILKINDPYRKDYYIREISSIFDIDKDIIKNDIEKSKVPFVNTNKSSDKSKFSVSYLCEQNFIASLFFLEDDIVANLTEDINADYFNNNDAQKIIKKILEVLENSGNIRVLLYDSEFGEKISAILAIANDSDYYKSALDNKDQIIFNYLQKLKKNKLNELVGIKNDHIETEKVLSAIKELTDRLSTMQSKKLEV